MSAHDSQTESTRISHDTEILLLLANFSPWQNYLLRVMQKIIPATKKRVRRTATGTKMAMYLNVESSSGVTTAKKFTIAMNTDLLKVSRETNFMNVQLTCTCCKGGKFNIWVLGT